MSVITQVSLEEQLRAHPGLDRQAIADLREWLTRQTHLPQLGDADLALFYLSNAYDTEATKENIFNYFVMRHHLPEFFATRRDLLESREIQQVYETVFIATLPQRTKDNHKVILARLMDLDPTRYNFGNAVKVLNMVMDAGVYEDGPDNKYVFVFDLHGTRMEHRKTLSWIAMKRFYDYVRKGSPVRWIGAHYTNTGGGAGNNDFQELVKERIVNSSFADNKMVQYHADMETLMDAAGMERSMLPREMGGEAGTAADLQKRQMKKLESLYAFFATLENKTRLPNTEGIPTASEIFGPDEAS